MLPQADCSFLKLAKIVIIHETFICPMKRVCLTGCGHMKTKLLSCTICALILIAFDRNVTAGADENQDGTSGISGNDAESRRQLRLGGIIDEPETNSSNGELPNEPNQTESPEGSDPNQYETEDLNDTEELGEWGVCEVLLPNPGQPRELTGNF